MLVYRVTEVFVADETLPPLRIPCIESSLPPLVPASGDGERDIACAENEKRGDIEQGFRAVYHAYPNPRGRREARREYYSLAPDVALQARILASIPVWQRSANWKREGGRYIPRLEVFLADQMWQKLPETRRDRPALPSYEAPKPNGPIATHEERQKMWDDMQRALQQRRTQVATPSNR